MGKVLAKYLKSYYSYQISDSMLADGNQNNATQVRRLPIHEFSMDTYRYI